MRIAKWITSGLFVLLVIVLLLSALSAYIILRPPASVITVPFRMFWQITMKIQVIIGGVVLAGYLIFLVFQWKKNSLGKLVLGCMIILLLTTVLNICSWVRIASAQSMKSVIQFDMVTAGSGRKKYKLDLKKDYAKEFGIAQCQIYQDMESDYKSTCVIYLNYGGWSVQDESFGSQIFDFCQKEGYTFIRFAVERQADENVLELAKKNNASLNQLLKIESFDKIFLCGGSAGGHLALLCAQKQSGDREFLIDSVDVDGVIALYPCVDPGYTYDYYIQAEDKNYGMLGRIGNFIYCALYQGTTGTLAGETKKLDEEVFGIRGSDSSYYEATAIQNCMDKDVPMLIVHGEADSMMPIEATRSLYSYLEQEHKPVAFLELPGVEHVFDMLPNAAWDRCEEEMTGFVRSLK